jgi:hypothetical protein
MNIRDWTESGTRMKGCNKFIFFFSLQVLGVKTLRANITQITRLNSFT